MPKSLNSLQRCEETASSFMMLKLGYDMTHLKKFVRFLSIFL